MTAKPFNDTFLKACRQEPTDHVPAVVHAPGGRYQPEYRAIRAKHTFLK